MPETLAPYASAPLDTFEAQYNRVLDAAECATELQLADFLGIRQSSISDAKRCKSIPVDWLLKLLRHNQTNPDWIVTGQGSRYLHPADDKAGTIIRESVIRPPEDCFAQELVNELVRRVPK